MTGTNEVTWLVEETDPRTNRVIFQKIYTDQNEAKEMYEDLLKNDYNNVTLQKMNKQMLVE